MHIGRTRFRKDIVAEFALPVRTIKRRRAVIICGGMPTGPGKASIMEFFARKGFWVFLPRYRGSWESGGAFLSISPERDVLDVIDGLPRGFTDLYTRQTHKLTPDHISIIGVSFGGPAALLASRDARVDKAVALSPVVDWRKEGRAEPLEWLYHFTKDAFGQGYRMKKSDWNKLARGKFYNPAYEADTIPGEKILIFHAKDDEVVPYSPIKRFAEKVGAKLITRARGGHLGTRTIMIPSVWNKIRAFLLKNFELRN